MKITSFAHVRVKEVIFCCLEKKKAPIVGAFTSLIDLVGTLGKRLSRL